jgi:signal transduction protein with GAF and PtsI domain
MKTIVNGLTVTIEECAGGFTARASFGTEKIIEFSATSTRDYAAVSELFEALKRQAIENLKELNDKGERS